MAELIKIYEVVDHGDGNVFDIYNIDFANLQDLAVNVTSKI